MYSLHRAKTKKMDREKSIEPLAFGGGSMGKWKEKGKRERKKAKTC